MSRLILAPVLLLAVAACAPDDSRAEKDGSRDPCAGTDDCAPRKPRPLLY